MSLQPPYPDMLRKLKIREAKDRYEQRIGSRRFDEVNTDYTNMESCLQPMRMLPSLAAFVLLMAFPSAVASTWTWTLPLLLQVSQDVIARKYGWEDVFMGKNPSQNNAACLNMSMQKVAQIIASGSMSAEVAEDMRQQFYLQTSMDGDSWLFSKDGC